MYHLMRRVVVDDQTVPHEVGQTDYQIDNLRAGVLTHLHVIGFEKPVAAHADYRTGEGAIGIHRRISGNLVTWRVRCAVNRTQLRYWLWATLSSIICISCIELDARVVVDRSSLSGSVASGKYRRAVRRSVVGDVELETTQSGSCLFAGMALQIDATSLTRCGVIVYRDSGGGTGRENSGHGASGGSVSGGLCNYRYSTTILRGVQTHGRAGEPKTRRSDISAGGAPDRDPAAVGFNCGIEYYSRVAREHEKPRVIRNENTAARLLCGVFINQSTAANCQRGAAAGGAHVDTPAESGLIEVDHRVVQRQRPSAVEIYASTVRGSAWLAACDFEPVKGHGATATYRDDAAGRLPFATDRSNVGGRTRRPSSAHVAVTDRRERLPLDIQGLCGIGVLARNIDLRIWASDAVDGGLDAVGTALGVGRHIADPDFWCDPYCTNRYGVGGEFTQQACQADGARSQDRIHEHFLK